MEIDLIGDGVPGFMFDFGVNTDARNVGRVGFMPERTGTFSLVVRVKDTIGCEHFNNSPQRLVTVTQ